MAQKEIKLLEQQIVRLNDKGFDLEAWKKYTIIMLARIFGSNDEKIRQIEQLESEFSSWSLRDASGNKSYEERTKKLAKEILMAAIDEIKVLGISESGSDNQDKSLEDILNIIMDELKGSQVKQLKNILSSRQSKAEKNRRIKELLEGIGEYEAYNMLTNMLMHPKMVKMIEKD